MHFLTFSSHFDRDKGLDVGRLCLRHLELGTIEVWTAWTSTAGKQHLESFHDRGGMIPPEYRVPSLKNWEVLTTPISMPNNPGVAGNFYKINPHEVITDKGNTRSDFGIHLDANTPGSLGCIVMDFKRFADFEQEMLDLARYDINAIPLFITYS